MKENNKEKIIKNSEEIELDKFGISTSSTVEYERQVTAFERLFMHSPFSTVALIMRIRGNVSGERLKVAVSKVQERHINLRMRIKEDPEHNHWFTTENVGDIPIEIVSRKDDEHWIAIHGDAIKIPFMFEERPSIRFILVHSPNVSELIILCHHIICDGLSLAFLARDLMEHLGDPNRNAEVLPAPAPIDLTNLPDDVSAGRILKKVIGRINEKWKEELVHFDQEDYENINEAYWIKARHKILTVELDESQTAQLVDRCRKEKVTVNSALTAAFVAAPQIVQGRLPLLSETVIACNLRDRIRKPAGEQMGFFAGSVSLKINYNPRKDFWENARIINTKVQPLFTDKNMFKEGLVWCHLDKGILEGLNFKKLGGLVPSNLSRYEKISAFSKRNDVISSILKREKMESLDRIIAGTAVTNLTRMDFPRNYGNLELDRLLMYPGGAFPLSNVNLVLGAVTCSGKLSLVIEYDEGTVDTETMIKIKNEAMSLLLISWENLEKRSEISKENE